MIALKRTEEPKFLQENKEKWTVELINGGNFSWHKKQKELLEKLKSMTKNHCAFCDDLISPLGSDVSEIEHFKPKEKYKKLAFEWTNLFPICRHCNGTKKDRFDELLLKPDIENYCFNEWFRFDLNTFELKAKKLGNSEWIRAEITIKLYGFNKDIKVERREFEFDEIIRGKYDNFDKQPFRFISPQIV